MNNEIVKLLGFLPVAFVEEVCALIEKCDEAHSFEHVWDVMRETARLSGGSPTATIAAFMHDIGLVVDRERHHIVGAVMCNQLITKHQIACNLSMVEDAVMEHRNSHTGEYSSLCSEYVAAADRGRPDLHKALVRSYKYATSKLGKCHADAVQHAWNHTREMFLLKPVTVPAWYMNHYRVEWDRMLDELRQETVEDTAERLARFA